MKKQNKGFTPKEKYLLIVPSAVILIFSAGISVNIFNINGSYKTDVLLWLYPRTISILFAVILGIRNVLKGIRKNKSNRLRLGAIAVFTYTLTFCSTFAIPFLMSIKWETFITAFKVTSVFLLVLGNILFLIYLRKR
mgnify:FL=1